MNFNSLDLISTLTFDMHLIINDDYYLTQKAKYFIADSRTQNREALEAEMEKYKPTHVINAAGKCII